MSEVRAVIVPPANSIYLAHFLHHYLAKTHDAKLIIVADEREVVNAEVLEYFTLAHSDMFEIVDEQPNSTNYQWHFFSVRSELKDGWDTKARAHSM